MARMTDTADVHRNRRLSIQLVCLLLTVLLGAYLRFEGLGVRSLWWDELCTWHVSRMGLGDSLRWEPELTQAPLYQLCLRNVDSIAHTPEWLLRMPAAVWGVLTIIVGWWLGTMAAGYSAGLGLATLLAVNPLLIHYGREARAYTMLTLGCALAMGLWYRLVTDGRWRYVVAYIAVATLAMHAHYLSGLALAAQALWWAALLMRMPRSARSWRPLIALAVTGVLCFPVVYRHFHFQTSSFPGLEWIDAPSWSSTLRIITEPSLGRIWVLGVFLAALALWIAGLFSARVAGIVRARARIDGGGTDFCGLLLVSWLLGWGGLLLISLTLQPAMVVRYALPAAIPALLLPLIVAHRIDKRLPLILASVFALGAAPEWMDRQVDPGIRELVTYLEQEVDVEHEMVVWAMTTTAYHDWHDAERLGFQYYRFENVPVHELHLAEDGVTATNEVLSDRRGVYLVVMAADPFAVLQAAGRRPVSIVYEGQPFSQLLFTPYRLVYAAPIE